jgi:hypothetical protein
MEKGSVSPVNNDVIKLGLELFVHSLQYVHL